MTHASTEELFVRAGLGRTAGKVYDALTRLKEAGVADVCREAGVHRPTAYRALSVLEKEGLLRTSTKGKRAVYLPVPPERLLKALGGAAKDNKGAFDELLARFQTDDDVTVLRGPKGLAQALERMTKLLKPGGIFYRISSRKPGKQVEKYMPAGYRKVRDKKRIEQFVIVSRALREATYENRLGAISHVVPQKEDRFEYDVNVLMYGEEIAIVDFGSETAYVIANPRVAALFRATFKMLFDRLPA